MSEAQKVPLGNYSLRFYLQAFQATVKRWENFWRESRNQSWILFLELRTSVIIEFNYPEFCRSQTHREMVAVALYSGSTLECPGMFGKSQRLMPTQISHVEYSGKDPGINTF